MRDFCDGSMNEIIAKTFNDVRWRYCVAVADESPFQFIHGCLPLAVTQAKRRWPQRGLASILAGIHV
jgi:hypothetical protein